MLAWSPLVDPPETVAIEPRRGVQVHDVRRRSAGHEIAGVQQRGHVQEHRAGERRAGSISAKKSGEKTSGGGASVTNKRRALPRRPGPSQRNVRHPRPFSFWGHVRMTAGRSSGLGSQE
jgi:hypothetical protein